MRGKTSPWRRLWLIPLLMPFAFAQQGTSIKWEPAYRCGPSSWNDVVAFFSVTLSFVAIFGSITKFWRAILIVEEQSPE